MTAPKYDINPQCFEEDYMPATGDSGLVLVHIPTRRAEQEKDRYARNVYLVDKDRNVIWQIKTDHDRKKDYLSGEPFISLRKTKDGEFIAYRWSGFIYLIDMRTGHGKSIDFAK